MSDERRPFLNSGRAGDASADLPDDDYLQTVAGPHEDNDVGDPNSTTPTAFHPRKGLDERHIGVMAVAGMLGTGIFLTSGRSLADAGPAGSLLGYFIMGLVTMAVALTAAEMSALSPATGGFIAHAGMFVDPALGAATGWNFAYALAIVQSVEICACTMLVSFWTDAIPQGLLITGFWLSMVALNMMPVRVLGEIEFSFGLIKITMVVALVILGLVIDLGVTPSGKRLGLKYWQLDAFRELSYGTGAVIRGFRGRFLAVWSTLINAAFAFAHVQLIAIAGTETVNPRRSIPRALFRTSVGVFGLYLSVICIVGLIIPATHPGLPSATGTARSSPFAIAAKEAGIHSLASVINAVVLTSAFSAGVTSIFVSSRSLVALANESNGPAIFGRTDGRGVPFVAVIAASSLGALSYMTLGKSSAEVFIWLVNISAAASLVSWCVLCFSYLRLQRGMAVQGYTRADLPYAAPLQPYLSWFAFITSLLTLLFCGFDVFLLGNFRFGGLLASYANVPVFLAVYILWKWLARIKTIGPHDMNLSTLFMSIHTDSTSRRTPPTEYVPLLEAS